MIVDGIQKLNNKEKHPLPSELGVLFSLQGIIPSTKAG